MLANLIELGAFTFLRSKTFPPCTEFPTGTVRLRLPAALGPYWNSAWIWVLPMSLPMLIVTVTGLVVPFRLAPLPSARN